VVNLVRSPKIEILFYADRMLKAILAGLGDFLDLAREGIASGVQ
jgi:hypothetical protein